MGRTDRANLLVGSVCVLSAALLAGSCVCGDARASGWFKKQAGGAITSASIPDPYTPADGTWNVTGGIDATSTVKGRGVTIGASGTEILSSNRNSFSITWADITATVCVQTGTFSVLGAAIGDECTLGIPATAEDISAAAGNAFSCYVSGANLVKVVQCCNGGTVGDPCSAGTGTYSVRVFSP